LLLTEANFRIKLNKSIEIYLSIDIYLSASLSLDLSIYTHTSGHPSINQTHRQYQTTICSSIYSSNHNLKSIYLFIHHTENDKNKFVKANNQQIFINKNFYLQLTLKRCCNIHRRQECFH